MGKNGSRVDMLGRHHRRSAEFDDAIIEAYVRGASTRLVCRITKALVGERVSRSPISCVTASLGEIGSGKHRAPAPIPYLFLDATVLDARAKGGESRRWSPRPKASRRMASASSWR